MKSPTFASLADVAKLADAPDLGSGAVRRVGSTPIIRTKYIKTDKGLIRLNFRNSI